MRRALLNAVEEPRRRLGLVPVLATALAAALSLLLVWALWHGGSEAPRTAPLAEPRQAAVQPPAAPRPAPAIRPAPPPAVPRPAVARHPRRRPHLPQPVAQLAALPVPLPEAPVLAAPAEAPEEPEPMRQVQFATAGGTRIIWVLPEQTR